MNKTLQTTLAAFALTATLGFSNAHADSVNGINGTQYYPTYSDYVTNVYTYNQYKQL